MLYTAVEPYTAVNNIFRFFIIKFDSLNGSLGRCSDVQTAVLVTLAVPYHDDIMFMHMIDNVELGVSVCHGRHKVRPLARNETRQFGGRHIVCQLFVASCQQSAEWLKVDRSWQRNAYVS